MRTHWASGGGRGQVGGSVPGCTGRFIARGVGTGVSGFEVFVVEGWVGWWCRTIRTSTRIRFGGLLGV